MLYYGKNRYSFFVQNVRQYLKITIRSVVVPCAVVLAFVCRQQ